ncbi:MAG: Vms1/Ankzf1 family peptidyl-tRNA hydrolase [Acidimicrobiales bacterium]
MDTTTSITNHPVALTEALEHHGAGTATVYLPSPSDNLEADDRFSIRRRNVAGLLDKAGASPATIATIETALENCEHGDGEGFVVVARDEELVLVHETRRPIDGDHVAVGPLPQLLPAIAATQHDLPHLAVLLDRTGADLFLRSGPGAVVAIDESEGDDTRIQRSHPGGWSQRRFQQIAENAWENNAKDVVADILSAHPDVELLVVGGDVRAVGFFEEHVPERLRPVLHAPGSRQSDHEAFLAAADTLIADVVARQMTEVLQEVRGAVKSGGGVEGDEVLDLLSQGRVRRLIVGDDTLEDDRPTAYFDLAGGFRSGPEAPDGSKGVEAVSTDAALFLALRLGVEVIVAPSSAIRAVPPLAAVLHE